MGQTLGKSIKVFFHLVVPSIPETNSVEITFLVTVDSSISLVQVGRDSRNRNRFASVVACYVPLRGT